MTLDKTIKPRISLTIDSSLLALVDATVDGLRVKNRSHAIELLLSKALESE